LGSKQLVHKQIIASQPKKNSGWDACSLAKKDKLKKISQKMP